MKIPGVRRLVRFKRCVSTQTTARRLASAGALPGTLIVSDTQSGGRGRMDRRWSSGKGGLYFSLILRPAMRSSSLASLSLAAGRELARVLAAVSGAETKVKRPNDVLARPAGSDGPFRKICGILIEAAGSGGTLDWVIIGVGINVSNRLPKGLFAASLNAVGRSKQTPHSLLAPAVGALRRTAERFDAQRQ